MPSPDFSRKVYPERPPLRRWAAISIAYFLVRSTVELGSGWLVLEGGFSLWYPPAGIDVALLYVFGPWYLPALAVTQVRSILMSGFAPPPLWLVPLVLLHVAGFGGVIAFAVLRLKTDPRFATGRDVLKFIGTTVLALPIVVALGQVSLLVASGILQPADFWTQVAALSIGDATGIAMVTPVVVLALRKVHWLWWNEPLRPMASLRRPEGLTQWLEIAAVVGLTLVAVYFGIGARPGGLDLRAAMAAPVLWAALRYGIAGAAPSVLALNVVVAIDVALTSSGDGIAIDPVNIQLALVSISIGGVLIGALVDEDRQARDNAEDMRLRLLGAFRASPNPITLMSLPDFKIIQANDAFRRLSGIEPNDEVGATTGSLGLWVNEEERLRHRRMTMQGPVRDQEYDLVSRRGEVRPISFSTEVFGVGDQQYLLTVARDMTEQRQAERDVLGASERERRQLGRELHDHLGQSLTGLAYLAKALQKQLDPSNKELSAQVEAIEGGLAVAIQQARRIAHGLHPHLGEWEDLEEVLSRLATHVSERSGFSCVFLPGDADPVTDPTASMHLYRITQETIVNALRHGEATHVRIKLLPANEDGLMCLQIDDDGTGTADQWTPSGMGVRNMQYRAAQMGGHIRVDDLNPGLRVECYFRRDFYPSLGSSQDRYPASL